MIFSLGCKKISDKYRGFLGKIILLFAGDEERAFEVFFQLLEEFKNRHAQIFVEKSTVKAMTVEALQ